MTTIFFINHAIMFGVKRKSMIISIKIANSVDMWNKASMFLMIWFMQIKNFAVIFAIVVEGGLWSESR